MKYLKERFGYYFQFKNTLNGTDYFFRSLGVIGFFVPMVIFIGIGIALITSDLKVAGILSMVIGGLFIVPAIWFSLATTYKRINAFFPGKAGWLLAATFVYNLILEGFNPNNNNIDSDTIADMSNYVPFSWETHGTYFILFIPALFWSAYLLFANSPIAKDKHIG